MGLLRMLGNCAEASERKCRISELTLLEHNPQAAVVDLGCEEGNFTLWVAGKVGASRVCGVDVESELVERARSKGIDAKYGDLNKAIPWGDEEFDVVVASHIIEHLCDTDNFLREMFRILKPSGYAIIATPNLGSLPNIALLMMGKQPSNMEVSDVVLVGTVSPRGNRVGRVGPAHRRMFTKPALIGLLEYYGFTVEQCLMDGSIIPLIPIPERFASNIIVKARKRA